MKRHRVKARALAALLALLAPVTWPPHDARAGDDDATRLAKARVLDQQGVRSYAEGRYNEAIRYFEEAFHLGGPPSELWNIAKCHVRLDDPEEAAKTIREYLDQKGLTAEDRREAQQQLEELEHRHSAFTVASSPSGATVYLEGHRWAGVTPATIDVAPGEHKVTIEARGYEPYDKSVEAKWGHGIIVDATLSRSGAEPAPAAASPPEKGRGEASAAPDAASAAARPHRLVLEGALGAMLPRYGSVGGAAGAAGFLSASWVPFRGARVLGTLGARVTITGDSWSNTVGAPSTATTCGTTTIPSSLGGTAVSAFLAGGVAWRASSRFRVGGDLGLGVATFSASQVGGDLFEPTCRPSPGVKPAVHLGGELSYAFSRELRLVALPLVVEVSPAFDGARGAPKDASGPWMRFGAALGLAFDVL
jgi:hypothetical protein